MCEKGTHVNPSKSCSKATLCKNSLAHHFDFHSSRTLHDYRIAINIITCNPIGSGIFGVHIGVDEFAASMIHYDFSALIAHDYNFSLVFRWPFLKILCLAIVQTCC